MVNSESLLGAKPDDSGVVIGYQIDEFTCTLLAEHFVAQLHIHPCFKCKVSTVMHLPLEPGYEDSLPT